MVKKVIQVPVDEKLLKDLDSLSRRQHKARAELIRRACRLFLKQVEHDEMDKIYREGYIEIPERPEVGEIQEAITGEILNGESW